MSVGDREAEGKKEGVGVGLKGDPVGIGVGLSGDPVGVPGLGCVGVGI